MARFGGSAKRLSGGSRLADPAELIRGTARLGRRTKDLVKRLEPGEIAIIDHRDLDRISAEELVDRRVAAVINVAESTSGHYPNVGPLLLTRAGIRLVEAVGAPLFELIDDGSEIVLEGGSIRTATGVAAEGRQLDTEELALELERQRAEIDDAIEAFAENTVSHLRQEGAMLTGRIDFPHMETIFRDRHALIVVRGTDYKKDLRTLRAYIRDVRPVLIGVDGGADAIVEAGFKPEVVLGDMDSATDETLAGGAELVVHAYPDGRAPGSDRVRDLGLDHHQVSAPGTSQDVAMLLASEKGAELIVTVGAHFNLTEFLDKDRGGMSSTFLTRLRVGELLIDAKGVSRLYRPTAGPGLLAVIGVSFVALIAVIAVSSPVLDNVMELLWLKLRVILGI
ncbi:MAG: putative cytokinetic ring protein SteA [Solirubrobacterales bacterium]